MEIDVFGTGGTISSSIKKGEHGIAPTYSVNEVLNFVPEVKKIASIYAEMPITEDGKVVYVDSTNMQPEYIQQVAKRIFERYGNKNIRGVVILHGTDTMEESGADLTFELLYKKIPVVFTGSMKTIDQKNTDAVRNILHATKLASSGHPGTYIVFNRRIILASRAKKIHPSSTDAFRSINFSQLGTFIDDEPHYTDIGMGLIHSYAKRFEHKEMELREGYSGKVHLLELYRGVRPSIIDYFFEEGYLGLILKAFGTGGIPNKPEYRSLIPKIKRWSKERFVGIVSEAFTGQVTTDYEVTNLALDAGAVSLYDMLPRTALSKANWAFGQTENIEDAKKLMLYAFENEINANLVPRELRVSDEEIERILSKLS